MDKTIIYLSQINVDNRKWKLFSLNPYLIHYMSNNPYRIDVDFCTTNRHIQLEHCPTLLEQNTNKINLSILFNNPNAIIFFEKNKNSIDSYLLLYKPIFLYLEDTKDKINFNVLSGIPNAKNFLEENIDKINFYTILNDPDAIHLLEKNLDNWDLLPKNPFISDLDYEELEKRCNIYKRGLCMSMIKKNKYNTMLET